MALRLTLGGFTTLALAGITLSAAVHLPPAPAHTPGDPFAALVAGIAEAVLCGVCGWLTIATAASTVAAARGPGSLAARVANRLTPQLWKRALGVVLGGAVCLGQVGAPAMADESTTPGIVGLRLPDRPSGAAALAANAAPRSLVVRRGDTLWDIAADALPPTSTAADVARECRRWYAANRSVIGTDPDLLLPGMHLHPPSDQPEGPS